MIKHTLWSPLVCSCEIVYSWDNTVSEDERVHTVVSHKYCGGNHPKAIQGEHLETSEFFADYKLREAARIQAQEKVR